MQRDLAQTYPHGEHRIRRIGGDLGEFSPLTTATFDNVTVNNATGTPDFYLGTVRPSDLDRGRWERGISEGSGELP